MRLLRRSIGWTYLSWGGAVLSGLLLTPVVVRHLGTEEYGIWAFIGALAAYLALLDLGLTPAVVRFAAEARGRRSAEELRGLVSIGLVLYGAIGLAASLAGLGLAWLVPVFIDVPDELVTPARLAAALLVLGMSVRFPLGFYGSLLLGQQRYDVVGAAAFLATVAYTVLVLALLPQGGGLVLLAGLSLVAAILRLVFPLFWVRRELGSVRPEWRHVSRARLRPFLSVSGDNILIHVAARVVFTSDVLIVGIILGPEAAAYYAVAAKLFAVAFGVGTAGTNLLFPAFAELEGAADETRQRALLRDGLRVGMSAMLIFALPLLLYPDLVVEAWIGGGFEETTPALAILAAALLLQLPTHVTSQYLMARGLQRRVALVSTVTAVMNIGLSIALARTVGLWGVALATLATSALAVVAIPLYAASASRLGPAALARAVARPLVPGVLAAALIFGGARVAGAADTVSVAAVGVLWIVFGGAALWRLGLDSPLRRALLYRLRASEKPESMPAFSGADYY